MFRSFGQAIRYAAVKNGDYLQDPRLQLMARLWIQLSEQDKTDIALKVQNNSQNEDDSADVGILEIHKDATRDYLRRLDNQAAEIMRRHGRENNLDNL